MKVSLGDAVKGTEERLHRSTMPEQFVADSLLEGGGFEPSVPLAKEGRAQAWNSSIEVTRAQGGQDQVPPPAAAEWLEPLPFEQPVAANTLPRFSAFVWQALSFACNSDRGSSR